MRLLPRLLLTALTLAALLPATARAEWTLQASGIGQDAGYFQISAADATHAMAVGTHDSGQGSASAVVAVTTDGVNWLQTKPSAGTPGLIDFYTTVHMVSPQKAFVGMIGKVLATQDGGGTWTAYTESAWGPLKGPTISGIAFAGPMTGYLVGSGGTLRKSSDGGVVWAPLASPADVDWKGLFVLDADHVWLWAGDAETDEQSGEVTGYSGGTLARTTDGGKTWSVVFDGEPRAVSRVFMINADEGYLLSNALAGPRLEHTTDGGKTWTAMALPDGSTGAPDTVHDVVFFDLCEGFLLQEKSEQTQLMYTTDRGATWTQVARDPFKIQLPFPIPIYARFMTLAFPSRQVGFAGGFFESLAGYSADGPGPGCGLGHPDGGLSGDGGSGGDDGGGGGCGCRAAGGGGALPLALVALALGAGLGLARRRRR